MIIWVVRSVLYSSSVYSCHLFLISPASVRSILFLSFIVPIFAWNVSSVSLIFLKGTLVFPILLFSSISFHWSLRKAFSYLHYYGYIFSFSPLPLTSLLFSAICKAISENHFDFCIFFPWGWSCSLSPVQSRTSIHSSSGTLSIRFNPLILFATSTL